MTIPSFFRFRARRGRLLVECLVAMLLLDVSALVVVALARSASASTRTAQLTADSWALASQGIEAAVAAPCTTGVASGVDVRPSVVVRWTDHPLSGWRERDVQVALLPSPLADAVPRQLSERAAWSCP